MRAALFDTTVLSNFAHTERPNLLQRSSGFPLKSDLILPEQGRGSPPPGRGQALGLPLPYILLAENRLYSC